jgi:gamma-glutamyltranspeptidase/glutathione hydrolase
MPTTPKKNKKKVDSAKSTKIKLPEPQRVAASKHGMVSTAQYRATEAGVHILEQGGNAIDAAVAAAFALGVCEPQASGLGGQTMMMIYHAEPEDFIALDGSSRAPSRAIIEDFSKEGPRLVGHTATTVPSTPATLAYALERFGTFELARVLEPAISLAEDGYGITPLQRKLQRRELKTLKNCSGGSSFLHEGKAHPSGSLFKQPTLGKTLRRLAEKGIEDFYTGGIAESIHKDMQKNGGLLHKDDLAKIPYPIEREPISSRFSNMYIHTMPPPGAGRTLVEMLNILKRFPKTARNLDTPENVLLLAEVIRRAQLDRRDRPYDPNFYPQVQDRRMTSAEYARLVSEQIQSRLKAGGETTHLSVADRNGNFVGLTQSIERVYGAKVIAPGLGFLYNNYMSAFEYGDISHPYYLRPNGVPWASVAPTIIFKGGKPWLVIGSPGSDRITSTILQVLLRLPSQSPFDSVEAPRMHCAYDGRVSIEASHMRDDIPDLLRSHGFTIDIHEPMSFYLGCVQMVVCQDDEFIGVADPRRDGSAQGPKK